MKKRISDIKKKFNPKLLFGVFVAIIFVAPMLSTFLTKPSVTGLAVKDVIGGFKETSNDVLFEGDKVIVWYFGQTSCSACSWEKPILDEIAEEFDNIVLRKYDFEVNPPSAEEFKFFNTYSPEGHVPLVVIGGRYYRIGSGKEFGEEGEKEILKQLVCALAPGEKCVSSAE